MNIKTQTKTSKRLSLVLRHNPQSVGITLDSAGWTDVNELLRNLNSHGMKLSQEALLTIVNENSKRRFEFNENKTLIRARQGHSVNVDLGYKVPPPPDTLYHGTPEKFITVILKEGLTKQQRHHVHLSTNIPLMLEVARRRGHASLLKINAKQMYNEGHSFYLTENDVWLADHIPARYLEQIDPTQILEN